MHEDLELQVVGRAHLAVGHVEGDQLVDQRARFATGPGGHRRSDSSVHPAGGDAQAGAARARAAPRLAAARAGQCRAVRAGGAGATPLLRARFVAAGDGEVTPARPESPRPTLARAGLWTALAAMGSVMLIATTNAQSRDVAATPLLWVVPLAVYLLTFIICFDREDRKSVV